MDISGFKETVEPVIHYIIITPSAEELMTAVAQRLILRGTEMHEWDV